MLIESVKRWTIIALLIVISLLVLVVMAMRVDVYALQGKTSLLEQTNQNLMEVAKHNADQVRAMIADAKANDELSNTKQQAKAAVREQTRSNTYVVHQALSTESCATVRLPDSTISLLRASGGNQDRGALPNTTRIPDT